MKGKPTVLPTVSNAGVQQPNLIEQVFRILLLESKNRQERLKDLLRLGQRQTNMKGKPTLLSDLTIH